MSRPVLVGNHDSTDDRHGSAALALELLGSLEQLTDLVVESILAGDHAYAESTLLTRDELAGAVRANTAAILRTLAGETVGMDAPRDAGRLKARQGVPLAGVMHAFRLAGRQIWSSLVELAEAHDSAEALVHMASDAWGMIDDYSVAAADAYREYMSEQAIKSTTERDVMLTALLDGTVDSSARASEIVRLMNLPDQGVYLVVCAEIDNRGSEPLAGIEERLRAYDVFSAWTLQPGRQVGLIGVPAGRSLDAVEPALSAGARSRIGVSRPFTSPLDGGAARREAQLASRCLPPGQAGTHVYGSSVIALMIATAPDAAHELTENVLGRVTALPRDEAALLLDTLQAWFDSGGSSAATAAALHCHRNTVLYRLNRLTELTGRSVNEPSASAELCLALATVRLEGLGR